MSRYGFTYDPFPGVHYIHPFHELAWEYFDNEGKEHPRTVRSRIVTPRLRDFTGKLPWCQVVEMRMCALSNAIREKPNWWEKIKDPALIEKWTQETLDEQKSERRIRQLTKGMVIIPKSFALTWD